MFRTTAPQLMLRHQNPIHLAMPTLCSIVSSVPEFIETSLLFKFFHYNSVRIPFLPCVAIETYAELSVQMHLLVFLTTRTLFVTSAAAIRQMKCQQYL
jgi:hypothetical protein